MFNDGRVNLRLKGAKKLQIETLMAEIRKKTVEVIQKEGISATSVSVN